MPNPSLVSCSTSTDTSFSFQLRSSSDPAPNLVIDAAMLQICFDAAICISRWVLFIEFLRPSPDPPPAWVCAGALHVSCSSSGLQQASCLQALAARRPRSLSTPPRAGQWSTSRARWLQGAQRSHPSDTDTRAPLTEAT